jgi:hypothetical protein
MSSKQQYCERCEQLKVILQTITHQTIVKYNYIEASEFFIKNKNNIDIVIVLSDLKSNNSFSFLSTIKKIHCDMPFLVISESNNQHFESRNYIQRPVNFKELLEKIYILCAVDHQSLDIIVEQICQNHIQKTNALTLSEDDLWSMISLLEDYEDIIGNIIYNKDTENINVKSIHSLLQTTYNIFYTFVDEEIKNAIEPFSIVLISFADTVINIPNNKIEDSDVQEIIMMLLEDILKFIEQTVDMKKYVHSQYLLDSFISNIEFLKSRCEISEAQEDMSELEFF